MPVRVMEGALPAALLQRVRRLFEPASPFWPEHGYPTPNFFSYNLPLRKAPLPGGAASERSRGLKRPAAAMVASPSSGGSRIRRPASTAAATVPHARRGVAAAASRRRGSDDTDLGPGGALIAAVAAALLPEAMALMKPGAAPPDSIEWWAHSRAGAGAGHQLHFDLDEAALDTWREEEGDAPPPHPDVSCVLYLDDGGVSGAPTLVTDQHVADGDGAGAKQGWLCWPQANRALLFDGGLLHAVVPGGGGSQRTTGKAWNGRTTLMIGFWRGRPAEGSSHGGGPRSNMYAPYRPRGRSSAAATWPALCTGAGATAAPSPAAAGRVVPVKPLWTKVPPAVPGEPPPPPPGELGVSFVARFFLSGPPGEIRDEILFPLPDGISFAP
eukprot:NODE_9007_length_1453_cov_5.932881.p1 GENE.NODE_9007_length_1453_cov_5.932881~~NODE_9007_length_1453_cov_5.932881.p1  ORF type:complete len:402 (-),score=112.09 NODE_9007_length_1453_cov_5.932881:248-1399(-)